jgi:hypothetical protein
VLREIGIPFILKITNGNINASNGDNKDNAGLAKLKKPKKCKNME